MRVHVASSFRPPLAPTLVFEGRERTYAQPNTGPRFVFGPLQIDIAGSPSDDLGFPREPAGEFAVWALNPSFLVHHEHAPAEQLLDLKNRVLLYAGPSFDEAFQIAQEADRRRMTIQRLYEWTSFTGVPNASEERPSLWMRQPMRVGYLRWDGVELEKIEHTSREKELAAKRRPWGQRAIIAAHYAAIDNRVFTLNSRDEIAFATTETEDDNLCLLFLQARGYIDDLSIHGTIVAEHTCESEVPGLSHIVYVCVVLDAGEAICTSDGVKGVEYRWTGTDIAVRELELGKDECGQ